MTASHLPLKRMTVARHSVTPAAIMICFLTFVERAESQPNSQQRSTNQLASARNVNNALPVKDFHIRVDVYIDDTKPPISSVQTIFSDGLTIELDDFAGRHTVVDSAKGRITLLDERKRSLVHLDMQVIETQLEKALALLTPQQQAAFAIQGLPQREADNYISISNKSIRYTFQPTTAKKEIAASYGEFSDWVTRINGLYRHVPPQLRLQLNKMLVDQSQLPTELRRTIVGSNMPETVIARLNLTESLSDLDRSRIAKILTSMQEFKPTSENEFFK
jgi:hypothetical protein